MLPLWKKAKYKRIDPKNKKSGISLCFAIWTHPPGTGGSIMGYAPFALSSCGVHIIINGG
jgi:hypothetical protein